MDSAQGIETLLAVAQKFEQIGAQFYLQAAQRVEDPAVKQELERLAEMEVAHDRAFVRMRAQYTGGPVTVEVAQGIEGQLKASRDSRVFALDLDPARKVGEFATLNEIIDFAIALEKNSIVFYAGLLGLVSEPSFSEVIQRIIQEELSHLSALTDLPVY